jgi:hypothetical protein
MNDLKRKIKELLIERLKFEALEIVVMLESEFGIKVKNESAARENFQSVAALAGFVEQRLAEKQQAQA